MARLAVKWRAAAPSSAKQLVAIATAIPPTFRGVYPSSSSRRNCDYLQRLASLRPGELSPVAFPDEARRKLAEKCFGADLPRNH